MVITTANRDDWCLACGYPFDTGDKCYDVAPDLGILACSKACAEWLSENENKKENTMSDKSLETAMFSNAFPSNPIPFLLGLAEHVKQHGTASIQSDEAKRVLFVVVAQAYGQLATVDLMVEWSRLKGTAPSCS